MEKELERLESCAKEVSSSLQRHYGLDRDTSDTMALVLLADGFKMQTKAKVVTLKTRLLNTYWRLSKKWEYAPLPFKKKVKSYTSWALSGCLIGCVAYYFTLYESPLPHKALVSWGIGLERPLFMPYSCFSGTEICVPERIRTAVSDASSSATEQGITLPGKNGRTLTFIKHGKLVEIIEDKAIDNQD